MTLNLPFSTAAEARLREVAAAFGQDVEVFVLQAVAEKIAGVECVPQSMSLNNDDWKRSLRACIELHPVVTHVVDDSRESIYAGRGE